MARTNIPFVDASLNFFDWKCTPVSAGCRHCYAKTMAEKSGKTYEGVPTLRDREIIGKELKGLHGGETVYVNGNTDTYHEGLKLETIKYMHDVFKQTPHVLFIVCTKRPEYIRSYAMELAWPDNLWLGVSVENNEALGRIDNLQLLPAKHKWIAFEPLLEELALSNAHMSGIEWIMAGGETGDKRRTFNQFWASQIKDRAVLHNIPFWFKQGGSYLPDTNDYLYGVKFKNLPQAFKDFKADNRPSYKQGKLF